MLRIQILLALGLLPILIERRQVDRAQPGDTLGTALQLALPGVDGGGLGQGGEQRRQLAARLLQPRGHGFAL